MSTYYYKDENLQISLSATTLMGAKRQATSLATYGRNYAIADERGNILSVREYQHMSRLPIILGWSDQTTKEAFK